MMGKDYPRVFEAGVTFTAEKLPLFFSVGILLRLSLLHLRQVKKLLRVSLRRFIRGRAKKRRNFYFKTMTLLHMK